MRLISNWIAIPAALIGAVLSRWHGGGHPLNLPSADKAIKNIVWALACMAPVLAYTLINHISVMTIAWTCLVTFAFALIKATGHGRGFRYFEPMEEGSKPEKVEKYLLLSLIDKIQLPLYKALIMATTGALTVAGAAIAASYLHGSIIPGLVILLYGSFKGVAYLINRTEAAEFITGALQVGAIALMMFLSP